MQTRKIILLLATIAVLLALNLGYMIGNSDAKPIPLASSARAGQIVVMPNGDILTTSPDGRKLFLWYNSRNAPPGETLKYVEFN